MSSASTNFSSRQTNAEWARYGIFLFLFTNFFFSFYLTMLTGLLCVLFFISLPHALNYSHELLTDQPISSTTLPAPQSRIFDQQVSCAIQKYSITNADALLKLFISRVRSTTRKRTTFGPMVGIPWLHAMRKCSPYTPELSLWAANRNGCGWTELR